MNYDEAFHHWAAGTPLKTLINIDGMAYLRREARDRVSVLGVDDQALEDYLYNKSVYLSLRYAAGFNQFPVILSMNFCFPDSEVVRRFKFAPIKDYFSWEFNL